MPKIALLIDGGFFSKAIGTALNVRWPSADIVYRNALAMQSPEEELLRLYYYDSRPYRGRLKHPATQQVIDFTDRPASHARDRFLAELGQRSYVALRCGEVKARGWGLKDSYLRSLAAGEARAPAETDYEVSFEQKGVEMRIGLDVATLTLNRHVDRILIATNDTDFVPAQKLARRHGVQVVIPHVGSFTPHAQIVEDADFVRVHRPIP